jgi:energy-coupling factor transport system permease protein
MAIRIALLIFISSILTYTTTPNDLTDGIESLCSPLKFVGLGSLVHILTMMMTRWRLSFLPTSLAQYMKTEIMYRRHSTIF